MELASIESLLGGKESPNYSTRSSLGVVLGSPAVNLIPAVNLFPCTTVAIQDLFRVSDDQQQMGDRIQIRLGQCGLRAELFASLAR